MLYSDRDSCCMATLGSSVVSLKRCSLLALLGSCVSEEVGRQNDHETTEMELISDGNVKSAACFLVLKMKAQIFHSVAVDQERGVRLCRGRGVT